MAGSCRRGGSLGSGLDLEAALGGTLGDEGGRVGGEVEQ